MEGALIFHLFSTNELLQIQPHKLLLMGCASFFVLLSRHRAPSLLKTQDGGGRFLFIYANEPFPILASLLVGWILFFGSMFFIVVYTKYK
jgi:hypothetical protein